MVNIEIMDAVKLMLEKDGSMRNMRAQMKSNVVNALKGRVDINAGFNENTLVQKYIEEENGK
jgi:hypothetical protein